MNICFLSREYPPEQSFGGIGTHVHNLAHGMAEIGHDVDVICLSYGQERTLADGKVRVHRTLPAPMSDPPVSISRMGSAVNRWSYSLAFWRRLESIARHRHVDVLDTGELFSDAFCNSIAERFPQLVRLYTPLFWLAENRFHGIEQNAETELLADVERFCTLRSNLLTSPSLNLARIVSDRWSIPLEEIPIVPNPVDTSLFSAPPDGASSGAGPLVLFSGRLDKRKGVEWLLRAIPAVLERVPDARFRIVGALNPFDRSYDVTYTGLTVDLYRRGLSDRVEHVGLVDHFSMPAQYQAADLVVVPSLYDNSPNTAIEAMTCGRPVVGTTVGGIPEYVPDGVCGKLVPPGDSEALAAAIVSLLRCDALRTQMGRNGRQRALALYDRRVVAGQTVGLYEKTIERFRAGRRLEALRQVAVPRTSVATPQQGLPAQPPCHDDTRLEPGKPLVSVVMVNLNCGRFFDLIFPSLFSQTYRPFEVIVVDNGSTDGSVERLRTAYPCVEVVELHTNRGFSHATNAGIRKANGAFILTLNFDVVLEPRFIEQLVTAMREDERIGWAAGYVLKMAPTGLTGEIDCAGHYMTRSRYAHGFDLSKPLRMDDYRVPADVWGASACAALYRRAMLDDIAPDGEWFDEDFFAYFEDVDVDWRAQHRGWRCRYIPEAVGYHMRGGTGLIKQPEIAACELSNRFLMMIKNDSPGVLLRDWYPVLRRTARDLIPRMARNPRTVLIMARRIARYAPRMVKKRRTIMARSVAAPGHFGAFIR